MDIAAASIAMSMSNVQLQASTAMLDKSMEQMADNAAQLLEMMPPLEAGTTIDVRA